MTKNQIAYLDVMEKKRSNQRNEELTEWRDRNTLNYNYQVLGETNRHNLVTEGIDRDRLSETNRHNLVSETLEQGKLTETNRHNLATESFQNQQNAIRLRELGETARHNFVSESETQRSNLARETETYRTNLANERIKDRANALNEKKINNDFIIGSRNAATNEANVQLGYYKAKLENDLGYAKLNEETAWHDMQQSARLAELHETSTYHSTLTTETHRSNVAQELETRRSHIANETYNRNRLEEDKTHNRITEAETRRSNLAREAETNRHNKWNEGLGVANTTIRGVDTVLRIVNTIPTMKGLFNNGKQEEQKPYYFPGELEYLEETLRQGF